MWKNNPLWINFNRNLTRGLYSALVPLSGGIVRHAEVFVDPALSFAQGWNSILSWFISLPAELTAAAVIVSFWNSSISAAVWITIFGVLLVIANMLFVRVYGEMEFTFAMLKILLIVGCNLMVSDPSLSSILAHLCPICGLMQSNRHSYLFPVAGRITRSLVLNIGETLVLSYNILGFRAL